MIGTKETCYELLDMLFGEEGFYAAHPNKKILAKRRIELVNVLQELGLFCFYDGYNLDAAFSYRGNTFVINMSDPRELGFYAEIASFDYDDEDDKDQLHEIFNDINSSHFLTSIYEIEGSIVVSSCQYVGDRKIAPDEVAFILQTMDDTVREFYDVVKKSK